MFPSEGVLTEFDLAIGDHKIGRTGLIVDLGRLVQKLHEALRIHKIGVDRAVDVAEIVEGSVELRRRTKQSVRFRFREVVVTKRGGKRRGRT